MCLRQASNFLWSHLNADDDKNISIIIIIIIIVVVAAMSLRRVFFLFLAFFLFWFFRWANPSPNGALDVLNLMLKATRNKQITMETKENTEE